MDFVTLGEVLGCLVDFLVDLIMVALCFEFENFLRLRLGTVELARSVN